MQIKFHLNGSPISRKAFAGFRLSCGHQGIQRRTSDWLTASWPLFSKTSAVVSNLILRRIFPALRTWQAQVWPPHMGPIAVLSGVVKNSRCFSAISCYSFCSSDTQTRKRRCSDYVNQTLRRVSGCAADKMIKCEIGSRHEKQALTPSGSCSTAGDVCARVY